MNVSKYNIPELFTQLNDSKGCVSFSVRFYITLRGAGMKQNDFINLLYVRLYCNDRV